MFDLQFMPLDDKALQGLRLRNCGHQKCLGAYETKPGIRPHYGLHLILQGEGRFCTGGKEWRLSAGQGFVIFPHEVVSYRADEERPWEYAFISFEGAEAAGLTAQLGVSREAPVFRAVHPGAAQAALLRLVSLASREESALTRYGALMEALGAICSPPTQGEGRLGSEYLNAALLYIRRSYAYPLSVLDIAKHIGVDRTYLFRLFKEGTGQSPQAYLRLYRLKKARELLKTTELTLEEVAGSTGLGSAAHLSKVCREACGCSPGALRREEPNQEG